VPLVYAQTFFTVRQGADPQLQPGNHNTNYLVGGKFKYQSFSTFRSGTKECTDSYETKIF
jgi:hypothetical protein